VVAGEEYIGTCSDVWALGVILFAMVCGYLPYEDPNIGLLYEKIMSADYTAPNFISPQCRDLLQCIFETDPKFRYTIEQIRRHPWTSDSRVPLPTTFDLDSSKSKMEDKVFEHLAEIGMEKDDVKQRLDDGVHDYVTTAYYLFLKRMQSMAEDSWLEAQMNDDNDEDGEEEEANTSASASVSTSTQQAQTQSGSSSARGPNQNRRVSDRTKGSASSR
jgi:serine/threonine protein kinase